MIINRRYCLLLPIFLISVLSSCASGPPFKPVSKFDHEKALIYIYRESKGLGALVQHWVFIENKYKVKIANGGYSVLEVTPGKQIIYYSSKGSAGTYLLVAIETAITGGKPIKLFSFEPKAGKTYYLKFRLNTWNEDHTQPHSIILVENAVAKDEIAECKKIEHLKI